MLNKIKIFLFVFLLLINIKTECQWTCQTSLGINESLTYLCVVDSFSAWGIGRKGIFQDTGIVYIMEFGYWFPTIIHDFMCTSKPTCIAATDLNKAWIGTNDGKIYATTNGGFNWNKVFDFGGSGFINDIKFSKTNKLVGYANCDPPNGYGTPFKVIKTVDGGLNWTVYSPIFPSSYVGMASSSCVTDSNHYWMGLNCQNSGCGIGRIARTTNGGLNWLTNVIPHNADYVTPVDFLPDNMLGYCSSNGIIGNTYIHKSTNGGLSWSNYYLVNVEQNQIVNSINWIEGTRTWYFSISSPVNIPIYKSVDNGENWKPMMINLNNNQIEHMSFVRCGNKVWGYAAVTNGYIYRLSGDSVSVVRVNKIDDPVPDKFALSQNYPNPFNPSTIIKYNVSRVSSNNAHNLSSPHVSGGDLVLLKVYNVLGKEIETLVNEKQSPGTYEVKFDASYLPSGVYFYKLQAGDFTETKKMLMIK